jgi:hypothetical protein
MIKKYNQLIKKVYHCFQGSSVDLPVGSLTIDTEQWYIMKSAGFYAFPCEVIGCEQPVSDPGVESNYQIRLTGFGDIPTSVNAQASIEVQGGSRATSIPEGRCRMLPCPTTGS